MKTPRDEGFHQPAEWETHEAVWLAWPTHADLWESALPDAQREFVALCEAIADVDPTIDPRAATANGEAAGLRGDALRIVVRSEVERATAVRALGHLTPTFYLAEYGDIWLRDTGPIFLVDANGEVGSVRFVFNGWGGKYTLPGDAELSAHIQHWAPGDRTFAMPFVLEGGAIDVDGEGTLLTTRQCLQNPNRNPRLTEREIEGALCDSLGVEKVLWLDEGLENDHTDGHVDTIARFVAPGVVVCMAPSGTDDPNGAVLDEIAADLAKMVDAQGRRLQVVRLPSPGRVTNDEGTVMPASYVNFYIGNSTVVVPTYGSPHDGAAVAALAPLFPQHRVLGRPSKTILEGGGAFHCITQQQPRRVAE
jgi:agmatine deiminase